MCSRPFETRSLPSSLSAAHCGFTFYVAFPKTLHSTSRFAHLCRSHPSGSILTAASRSRGCGIARPSRSIQLFNGREAIPRY
jgi:hypothetical protein